MKNEIEDIGSNTGEKWRNAPGNSYIAGLYWNRRTKDPEREIFRNKNEADRYWMCWVCVKEYWSIIEKGIKALKENIVGGMERVSKLEIRQMVKVSLKQNIIVTTLSSFCTCNWFFFILKEMSSCKCALPILKFPHITVNILWNPLFKVQNIASTFKKELMCLYN